MDLQMTRLWRDTKSGAVPDAIFAKGCIIAATVVLGQQPDMVGSMLDAMVEFGKTYPTLDPGAIARTLWEGAHWTSFAALDQAVSAVEAAYGAAYEFGHPLREAIMTGREHFNRLMDSPTEVMQAAWQEVVQFTSTKLAWAAPVGGLAWLVEKAWKAHETFNSFRDFTQTIKSGGGKIGRFLFGSRKADKPVEPVLNAALQSAHENMGAEQRAELARALDVRPEDLIAVSRGFEKKISSLREQVEEIEDRVIDLDRLIPGFGSNDEIAKRIVFDRAVDGSLEPVVVRPVPVGGVGGTRKSPEKTKELAISAPPALLAHPKRGRVHRKKSFVHRERVVAPPVEISDPFARPEDPFAAPNPSRPFDDNLPTL